MSRLPVSSQSGRPRDATSSPLSLRIDRLVLDGVPPCTGGSESLRAALEAEIASLFASGVVHPALRAGAALPQLRVDADGLRDGADVAQWGRGIADALHKGIG
jgi:hypothetical protein